MTTAEKPALQLFLEDVFARLTEDARKKIDVSAIQMLEQEWRNSGDVEDAARKLQNRENDKSPNYVNQLKDAQNALHNHAYHVSNGVESLSNRISASIAANGPVTGLLYFSHAASELPKLGAELNVYQNSAALLEIVFQASGSAQLALEAVRADAKKQFCQLRLDSADETGELAGVLKGVQRVIRILDNTL